MNKVSIVFLLSILTGCSTLGPDYQQPQVSWLEDWQPDLYGQFDTAESQEQTQLSAWWQMFHDPVLDQLIESAYGDSPTMRLAGLRILESRAVLGIADSTLYPQVQQVTGGATYVNRRNIDGSRDYDQHFMQYSTGFNIGWELDFWGKFKRSIESADAAFFSSIANQQDMQVLLAAQMAELYFNYRTVLQRIEIAEKNAELQKRSLEITQQLFDEGQTTELDLQQAKSQYLATLAAIPQLENQQVMIRNGITVLLGRAPGDISELANVDGSLPQHTDVFINEYPAKLLLRRPDVRASAWLVAAQSAQIGIAEADYYPSISLFGSIGLSTKSVDNSGKGISILGGPSLNWNVFDHGAIENNIRLQDARLQQTIEAFQNTVLLAAQEIDNAAVTVVKTDEQSQILNETLKAAERSLELASIQYTEGLADFQRVLDAQALLAKQADRASTVRGQHIVAIVDLYRALGGGWRDMSVEQMLPQQTRDEMTERSDWGNVMQQALPTAPFPTSSDKTE